MKLYLKTLRDVPCMMDIGFKSGPHFLHGELEYDITNPEFLFSNDFKFELHDEQGWIGDYVIHNRNLDLIELYDENDEKISLEIWAEQNPVVSSSTNS